MHPNSYSSEGFVLGLTDFGEADRIVSVYSEKFGRIRMIAKGVRRLSSKKRGHLKLFAKINFSAVSGKNIDLITEVVSLKDFSESRESLKKIALAFYICEVIQKITNEGESNPRIFRLLDSTFDFLETAKKLKQLRLRFIESILQILGFWPEGKAISQPDNLLAEVMERQVYSERVGKRMVQ